MRMPVRRLDLREPGDGLPDSGGSLRWGTTTLCPAAYLAYVSEQPYAAHSGARERQLLDGCSKAGYMNLDGLATARTACRLNCTKALCAFSALTLWPALQHGKRGYLAVMLPR